jgi:DNA-directed RNA polymerase subunit N (RpoN/RPB10)|uniref:DNA-directed RNA polymerase subunit N n=1 Tax=viral metagenome TaxID=1070528 RepID=A0A6C0IVL4_9ZZZZ
MIYSTCPTCGFFIGNIVNQYELDKKKVCSNEKLSEEEQQSEISKLLKDLKVRRYCCRMRIMTSKDLVEEILSPNK